MRQKEVKKKYKFSDIAWRDLSLIAVVLVGLFLFSVAGMALGALFLKHMSQLQLAMISTLAQLMAYVVVIFVFYFLHIHTFGERFKKGLQYLKRRWFIIIIAFLLAYGLSSLYEWLMQFLPKHLQYSDTQNEMALDQLFKVHAFIPFAFLLIVIVGPIVEELVFRHILIGELGKKFNFIVMGIISAVLFTYIHVTDAKSPFEFGAYFILAIALVSVYLISKRNLAASISLHILNNLVSFIYTLWSIFYN